jgi:S1-C subfamily serine protease
MNDTLMNDEPIRKFLFIYVSLICSSFLPVPAHAVQLKVYMTSGTGFMVSTDGYLLTNHHVVQNCQRITVAGTGLPESEARVISREESNDLALLKVDTLPLAVGEFSSFYTPPHVGDRVVIVGYPGEAAVDVQTVTRETELLDTKGPQGEDKWLELGDVVEQGNSGGPLLNDSGQIIGIVTARAMTYTYRSDQPENGVRRDFGMALAVPVVRDFLDRHQVRYRIASPAASLPADHISDQAKPFIVNVRCEYKTEEVR